jgi:hypothetical protein
MLVSKTKFQGVFKNTVLKDHYTIILLPIAFQKIKLLSMSNKLL